MNIKLKAGLEVAGLVVGSVAVIAGVRAILTYLTNTYSPETLFNVSAICLVSGTAYVLVSLLYDIRVAQLQYKAKLKEMVDKK